MDGCDIAAAERARARRCLGGAGYDCRGPAAAGAGGPRCLEGRVVSESSHFSHLSLLDGAPPSARRLCRPRIRGRQAPYGTSRLRVSLCHVEVGGCEWGGREVAGSFKVSSTRRFLPLPVASLNCALICRGDGALRTRLKWLRRSRLPVAHHPMGALSSVWPSLTLHPDRPQQASCDHQPLCRPPP